MWQHIFKLVLIISPSFALACSCSEGELDGDGVKRATRIFVFRVVSAKLAENADVDMSSTKVTAEIKVVEELRGTAPSGRDIEYNSSRCCGLRLDIGHYYAAFLTDAGPKFGVGSHNLLWLGENNGSKRYSSAKLKLVVAGDSKFDEVYGDYARSFISNSTPPPPPPCPKEAE